METLYLVMPAYNEEENIENVIRSWYPILSNKGDDSRIVIADSGSSDRTHEILTELKSEFPKLEILTDSDRQHGPKLIALYSYAINKGADFIFQTDSDGQTNPDEFEAFWNARDEYDVVIGNRTVRGDGKSRAFVEKVVCLLVKMFFGVKVPDANAPFRLMKSSVVDKYLPRLPKDYFLPNIMMTVYFSFYHEKLAFRKISFESRKAGKNSINIPRIVKIGWKALGDFRRFRKDMKIEK